MVVSGKHLTRKEFEQITQEFNEEQKRWDSLRVGDLVYEEDYRDPFRREFFEHEIVSIDIDNRKLTTKDHSVGGEIKTLCVFNTIKELEEEGIKFETV